MNKAYGALFDPFGNGQIIFQLGSSPSKETIFYVRLALLVPPPPLFLSPLFLSPPLDFSIVSFETYMQINYR